jgi:hypothetical protein
VRGILDPAKDAVRMVSAGSSDSCTGILPRYCAGEAHRVFRDHCGGVAIGRSIALPSSDLLK